MSRCLSSDEVGMVAISVEGAVTHAELYAPKLRSSAVLSEETAAAPIAIAESERYDIILDAIIDSIHRQNAIAYDQRTDHFIIEAYMEAPLLSLHTLHRHAL